MSKQTQRKRYFSQQSNGSSELMHLMLLISLRLCEPWTWNSEFGTTMNNHEDQK